MSKIKSFAIFAVILSSLFCLCACGAKNSLSAEELQNLSLSEIFDNLAERVKNKAPVPEYVAVEITSRLEPYYLGASGLDYSEAYAFEGLDESAPFSVCLVRMNDNADIKQTKQDIKENINPRKWITSGVDDKNVVVDNKDNLIILIMWENSNELHQKFLEMVGK